MESADLTEELSARVRSAGDAGTALRIRGGDTKAFYGREPRGEPLECAGHTGIVNFEPTELVITARAGTPLGVIERALATENQMLPFEPPHFGPGATIGGTIACNLSGPRRSSAGAARDFLLGCRMINGAGQVLTFGGQVMKNVAGYDVSRLMCGAMGTLGVLLEVSLKVLPRPETERTLYLDAGLETALRYMRDWGRSPLAVSATLHADHRLYARLSGTGDAVEAASTVIGGDPVEDAEKFWVDVREHRLAPLSDGLPLWRLSVAPDTAPVSLDGAWVHEWGGGLRWVSTEAPGQEVRSAASAYGGHATLFRNAPESDRVFHPLAPGVLRIHRSLKQAFDPKGILNPGRMYPEF